MVMGLRPNFRRSSWFNKIYNSRVCEIWWNVFLVPFIVCYDLGLMVNKVLYVEFIHSTEINATNYPIFDLEDS